MEKFPIIVISKYLPYNFIVSTEISNIISANNTNDLLDIFYQLDEEKKNLVIKLLIAKDKFEMFKTIIPLYENINLMVDDNIFLIIAIVNRSIDIAKYLVQNGINVSSPDNFPIKLASGSSLEFTKLLVENGADVKADDNYPLKNAVYGHHPNIIKYLVENGADIHTSNEFPIRQAVDNQDRVTVQYLIEAGANIHAENEFALRVSSKNGEINCVRALLEAGADVKFLGINDLVAIIHNGLYNIIQLLIDYGVDFSVVNYFNPENVDSVQKTINLLLNGGVNAKQLALIMYLKEDNYDNW
jgi:ankyrin repeat protein